jgi:copper chaperone
MKTVTYSIPNISCKHCTHTIIMEISDIEGVKNVDADVKTKRVTIEFDDPGTEEIIRSTLVEIGYPAAT